MENDKDKTETDQAVVEWTHKLKASMNELEASMKESDANSKETDRGIKWKRKFETLEASMKELEAHMEINKSNNKQLEEYRKLKEAYMKTLEAKEKELEATNKELDARSKELDKDLMERNRKLEAYMKEKETNSFRGFVQHFSGFQDEAFADTGIDLKHHQHAEMNVCISAPDDALALVNPQDFNPKFWSCNSGSNSWIHQPAIESEFEVAMRLGNILYSVIDALGLDDQIKETLQQTTLSVKYDFVVLSLSNRTPVGCIEVKKPHSTAEDDKIFTSGKVAGQLFDQLQMIRLLSGLDQVFGLLTTGNKWCLVSTSPLPSTCPNASNIRVGETETKPTSTVPFHPHQVVQHDGIVSSGSKRKHDDGEEDNATTTEHDEEPRVLYASKVVVVQPGDETFITLIATAMLLMCESARQLDDKWSKAQVLARKIKLDKGPNDTGDSFPFATVPRPPMINFEEDALSSPTLKSLYLVQPPNSGPSHTACLAMTKSGSAVCVVKFPRTYRGAPSDYRAGIELEHWKDIYGDEFGKVMVAEPLDGVSCVIMPYFWPLDKPERIALSTQGESGPLWDVLVRFVEKRKLHGHITWRHIGRDPKTKKLVMFGLGSVEDSTDAQESKEWARDALATLKKRSQE